MKVNELLRAALKYGNEGRQVIPLYGIVGSRCECGKEHCTSPGKHPRVGDWRKAATTDPEIIRSWWKKWPGANIGMVTGKASGIVIVDIDGAEGDDAFRGLCANHNFLPETRTATTGKGRHHYFAHPGVEVKNSVRTVADGVDVRGDGGYIVAAPSLHQTGVTYSWLAEDQPLQQIPDWLLQRMLAGKTQAESKSATKTGKPIPEGRRNTELTSVAGRLRKRGLDEKAILEALLKENDARCVPPLDRAEVEGIAKSISKYAPGENSVAVPGALDADQDETVAQILIRLGRNAELFHNEDNEAFATVPKNGRAETWSLKSQDFKLWLAHQFWLETGSAASTFTMADALAVLAGHANFDGPMYKVFTRVAELSGNIYLDLANEGRQVVEITPAGWNIITNAPVRFRRPRGMRPLPSPVHGGSLDELRPFLNVASEEDWMMVIAWLLAAFRPCGPYPLAALHGEQGSAKTTTARVLRALVDPNMAPVRSEPKDGRDLMISATNGWAIVLDNLSRVSESLSDALCRLSTGGGFSARALYTDADEIILNAQRPVVLTGIEDLATRGDLLDRSLVIYLPRIPSGDRLTERKFWTAFEAAQPRILGALLTVVAGALRDLPSVELTQLPRLADFAAWIAAAESSLGWEAGEFVKALISNREDANAAVIESSLLAGPILKLVEKGDWSGTAEQLLRWIESMVSDSVRRSPDWPRTARGIAGALRRLAPNLRPLGVQINFGKAKTRDRTRLITIRGPVPSASSVPSTAQAELVN